MEITSSATAVNATNNNTVTAAATTTTTSATTTATVKTPEAESETPTRIQPIKPLSFSNGVLKRHQPLHHHHHYPFGPHHAVVVTYKECLKNHAASLGGHAVDGCGEFMPSPNANPSDPTSLKCAACGCHRNFHRREPDEPPLPPPNSTPALEYQPHHRHHPLPPSHRDSGTGHSSPSSPSPPPISSSYYPSAPHMLLALSSGLSGPPADTATPTNPSSSRKRFRTKFTQDQKEKMLEFAEKVGWKIQRRDDELINGFCNEVGVDRGVLKVWMHNNKNSLGKKDPNSNPIITSTITAAAANTNNGSGIGFNTTGGHFHHSYHREDDDIKDNININSNNDGQGLNQVVNAHGSSSSS